MINLDFVPSKSLALYLVKLFLTRTFAVLFMLVLVLMALDLLGESGKILAVPGNGEAELWRYVSLRVPLLIQRFLPFSALLGTLIVFTSLNQHSEVVSMKAAGLSVHQILAPLIHLKEVITYVRSHHERGDGYGYPDRLAGEAIPLGARIIGAVEIFDALTTARPYQEKMEPETAVERLGDLVGTVVDPVVHQALQAVVMRRQALVFLDDARV